MPLRGPTCKMELARIQLRLNSKLDPSVAIVVVVVVIGDVVVVDPRNLPLKGVLSSHKSVTGILPNNPTMLPPFSVFMNFHPKLSDSCSGLIIRLERSQCCN